MERLSGLDASFLYLETPTMLMNVAFVAMCDASEIPGGYSFRKLYDLIDSRTQKHPEFRRRLVDVPFNLHHPIWIDDPEFSIMNHMHQHVLPAPGSKRDFGRAVGGIMSRPLDRSKPLWEAWVIEGLENNHFALVMKFHHAVVDGISGTGLFCRLFDEEPIEHEPKVYNRSKGEKIPSKAEMLAFGLKSRMGGTKRLLNVLGDSIGGISSFIKHREQDEGVQRSRPMSAPRTHFNRRIGSNRDVAFVELSLADLKAVKNATDSTVNDVVLGVCGGALRQYLLNKEDLPEKSLISTVPISVRKTESESATNNQVSSMWSTLATHIDDPLERLKLIHVDTKSAKDENDALGADLLQDWAEFNTPGAFNLAVRLYTSSGLVDVLAPVHNTIISNVPGPRKPLYLAGSKIEALYPLGPVMEVVGLNISLASYEDVVGFALQADADLIADVGEIADLIPKALHELKLASGLIAKPKKRAAAKKTAPKTTDAIVAEADKTPSAKKETAKKTTAKKTTAKKAPVSKTTTEKTSAKKVAAKKTSATKPKKVSAKPETHSESAPKSKPKTKATSKAPAA